MKNSRYKFIYNPYSGKKRRMLWGSRQVALDEVRELFERYQIVVDPFPTKYPNHARKLAKEAVEEGYTHVIAAGGDGTISETANGLVGSNITMGIIPLGSIMNIARMLSIPSDLEKAVMLIKIGRKRKIDIGCVSAIGEKVLSEPYYFLEGAGIGLWAELHQHVHFLEKGKVREIFKFFHTAFGYYHHPAKITIDGKTIHTRASLVTISNGPYASAALKMTPQAKLNDHLLTVSLYKMSKLELMQYFYTLFRYEKQEKRNIETYQGKKIRIETSVDRLVHVDARKFGKTPVEITIVPNALEIISGFPVMPEESALKERTFLEG